MASRCTYFYIQTYVYLNKHTHTHPVHIQIHNIFNNSKVYSALLTYFSLLKTELVNPHCTMWERDSLRTDVESVLDPAGVHCVYLYTIHARVSSQPGEPLSKAKVSSFQ